MIIQIIFALTVGQIQQYGIGGRTVFHAALPRNGMGAWDDLPANFPTPAHVWLGSAPTNDSVTGTTEFTSNGSPASIYSPLASDGGWDDITNGMVANRFTGSGTYYDSWDDIGDPGTGDFTVCAITRGGTSGVYTAKRDSASGDGWALFPNSTVCSFLADDGSVSRLASSTATISSNAWGLCCGRITASGAAVQACMNGSCGTTAGTVGTVNVSRAWMVGGQFETHASLWTGDLVGVWLWSSALTDAQMATLAAWVEGIHDEKGATPTFSNTGPTCCWVDGQIECFSDDFPRKGCEIPPGLTGGGSPATCAYHAQPSVTNSIIQSIDLHTTWTTSNATVATSTASWYGDGRQQYKAVDADGTNAGYITQTLAKTATGTTSALCVCAATESSTGNVAMSYQETTGGGCSSPAEVFPAALSFATSTAAKCGCAGVTYADANCTNVVIKLYPTDAVGASQGHAAMTAEVFKAQTWIPSIDVPTTTAGVTAGADLLSYAATGIVTGGYLSGRYFIDMTYMPFIADYVNLQTLLQMDNGTANQRTLAYIDASEKWSFFTVPGGATDIAGGVFALTPGTSYRARWDLNYDSDKYQLLVDNVSQGTSTTARSNPSGQTTIRIGADSTPNLAYVPNACLQDVKIVRP